MSHPARPLRILIVSPETGLLHDLAWMLAAVGYSVETSQDVSQSAAWRRFCQTDFVLYDGRSLGEPTQTTLEMQSNNPIYRIFLYDPAATPDFSAWFAAGASDALRVPVSRGELLARIRAGARYLEFESRMRSQSARSQLLPELYSARGFLRRLSKFSTEGKSLTLGHTLLTISIDYYEGVCREAGASAARKQLNRLAESIGHSVSSNAITAHLDQGSFAVLLPGRKVAEARVIADQIASSFRAAQVDNEATTALSLSTAIVAWRVGVSPEQLLEQGQETLVLAQQSGGNCAIEQSDFAQELSNWQNELAAGSPFANVVAQDIMEPFPAILKRGAENRAMLAALRRGGAPVWPFVDADGKLVGVASPALATNAGGLSGLNLSDSQAISKPVTITHNAPFPEIYEAFSTQGCLTIVVVADGRPVGYLTCEGFLSLIEPIHSATFSTGQPLLDESRCLLVGSLASQFEPVSESDR